MTDETLRAAWEASTRPPADGPPGELDCPSPEAILELAERRVGVPPEGPAEPPPASLLLHLASCASCREELEITRSLLQAALEPEDEAGVSGEDATVVSPRTPGSSPPAGRRSSPPWMRMAAGVILVAGAAGIWQVTRPGGPGDVRRGGSATLMAVEAACPSPGRLVLTWEPVEGADRYVAELSGGDGRDVDGASTSGGRVELDVSGVLQDPEARWRVSAEGPLGPVAASRATALPNGCG